MTASEIVQAIRRVGGIRLGQGQIQVRQCPPELRDLARRNDESIRAILQEETVRAVRQPAAIRQPFAEAFRLSTAGRLVGHGFDKFEAALKTDAVLQSVVGRFNLRVVSPERLEQIENGQQWRPVSPSILEPTSQSRKFDRDPMFQRVLAHCQKSAMADVNDLRHAFGLGTQDVRRFIDELVRRGWVEGEGDRRLYTGPKAMRGEYYLGGTSGNKGGQRLVVPADGEGLRPSVPPTEPGRRNARDPLAGETEPEPQKSWADGPWCPGCRGTWPDRQALSDHLLSCGMFDLSAMEETEAHIEAGLAVDDKLAARYRRYQELGLGLVRGLGTRRCPDRAGR